VHKKLKIKPPPIQWSSVSTIGVTVAAGSYMGTILGATENHRSFVLVYFLLSFFWLLLNLTAGKRKTIYNFSVVALLLSFAGSQLTPHTKGWFPYAQNELVLVDITALETPKTHKNKQHEMSPFDYREQQATFLASISPIHQGRPTTAMVVIQGRPDIVKGDVFQGPGWFIKSAHKKHPRFYTTYKTTKAEKEPLFQIQALDPQQTTLFKAIFFGVRDSGWKNTANLFRTSGMSHILAMSGMHVALFVLVINLFCIKKNKVTKLLALLLVTLFLCLFVELRSPLVRAVSMGFAIYCTSTLYARCKNISIVSVVLIVILLIDPNQIQSVSFQLTFLVVGALCVLLPQLTWAFIGPKNTTASPRVQCQRKIASMWTMGLCAWCASAPIVAYVFHTISPSGIISNLPAVGVLAIVIFFGSINILLYFLTNTTFLVTTLPLSCGLTALLYVAETTQKIPHTHFDSVYPTATVSVMFFTLFAMWCTVYTKRKYIYIATIALIIYTQKTDTTDSTTTTITTIQVGHGASHIIQNNKHAVVIDAGSRNNIDIGFTKIIPTLQKTNVQTIDLLLITHADLDHIAGIPALMDAVPIHTIGLTTQAVKNATDPLHIILRMAEARGIQIQTVSKGTTIMVGELVFKIISPNTKKPYTTKNATSLVVQLTTNSKQVLFTGDIDEHTIRSLDTSLLTPDIVELPHHGQWSKESQLFIDSLCPKIVLQSTNKTRHSKDRWIIPLNTERYVTSTDGDITTTISGSGEIHIVGSKNPATMVKCLSHYFY
jgi:competence protein ComEC